MIDERGYCTDCDSYDCLHARVHIVRAYRPRQAKPPREDAKTLAARKARQIFSDRRQGHPGAWKAVHLQFSELSDIIESAIVETRNEETRHG